MADGLHTHLFFLLLITCFLRASGEGPCQSTCGGYWDTAVPYVTIGVCVVVGVCLCGGLLWLFSRPQKGNLPVLLPPDTTGVLGVPLQVLSDSATTPSFSFRRRASCASLDSCVFKDDPGPHVEDDQKLEVGADEYGPFVDISGLQPMTSLIKEV
eukprot:GGOE01005741.1.p1 GENE.GGOE01005741.1~~GGOE01005741.1.p1  ORF type:complete len:155 (-),score=23.52 GGOE01005741.1:864-1328(-)